MAIIRSVPCNVSFRYPNGVIRKGKVVKSTELKYHIGDKNGDYATRIELIKFENEKMPQVRFAYWRRPARPVTVNGIGRVKRLGYFPLTLQEKR